MLTKFLQPILLFAGGNMHLVHHEQFLAHGPRRLLVDQSPHVAPFAGKCPIGAVGSGGAGGAGHENAFLSEFLYSEQASLVRSPILDPLGESGWCCLPVLTDINEMPEKTIRCAVAVVMLLTHAINIWATSEFPFNP